MSDAALKHLRLPELGPHHALGSVRIPELHSVPLTRRFTALVDHPAFQRLRTVRQLGPTHLVYPGGDPYTLRTQPGCVLVRAIVRPEPVA